ncbi:replication-associated recombination protein A [Algiphilus sp.]|uniref:replication-associated recombination protein A n=1 Tax=Algiphilus sp. TaxID=1872431 RepID=UPI0025BC532A|nr:replication-associated recombination protein A [Algiphilus sp.]MCK5771842.1 replication-associated recombination protein A [Algiphilus sp.]
MVDRSEPLAARMRPRTIEEVLGQPHLLAPDAPLRAAIDAGRVPSMVFWGPPGCGKTTLARLLAAHVAAEFRTLSAVMAGVKDIREAVASAQKARMHGTDTVLFIDEIHRFNKAQQDALLPFVEDGTLTLVGATTENPSFELNSALLSRARVFVLHPLDDAAVDAMLERALTDAERGVAPLELPDDWRRRIIEMADGDARRALVMLEMAADYLGAGGAADEKGLAQVFGRSMRRFDKQGDAFYDQISALHKAVRGSDPDAALYWFCRMIDGGADPGYLARRLARMAYEDIGLADPKALQMALAAWDAYDRIGSPEGELALAEVVIWLAVAPKSNAGYTAYKRAMAAVDQHGSAPVPLHIRNAPTGLMKDLGYGKGYRYDHDEPEAHAAGQQFLPDALVGARFYEPTDRGIESRVRERLRQLRGDGAA